MEQEIEAAEARNRKVAWVAEQRDTCPSLSPHTPHVHRHLHRHAPHPPTRPTPTQTRPTHLHRRVHHVPRRRFVVFTVCCNAWRVHPGQCQSVKVSRYQRGFWHSMFLAKAFSCRRRVQCQSVKVSSCPSHPGAPHEAQDAGTGRHDRGARSRGRCQDDPGRDVPRGRCRGGRRSNAGERSRGGSRFVCPCDSYMSRCQGVKVFLTFLGMSM